MNVYCSLKSERLLRHSWSNVWWIVSWPIEGQVWFVVHPQTVALHFSLLWVQNWNDMASRGSFACERWHPSGYSQRSMVLVRAQTHRQRWMFTAGTRKECVSRHRIVWLMVAIKLARENPNLQNISTKTQVTQFILISPQPLFAAVWDRQALEKPRNVLLSLVSWFSSRPHIYLNVCNLNPNTCFVSLLWCQTCHSWFK